MLDISYLEFCRHVCNDAVEKLIFLVTINKTEQTRTPTGADTVPNKELEFMSFFRRITN